MSILMPIPVPVAYFFDTIDCDDDYYDEKTAYYMDYNVAPRDRKTRAMVMTQAHSIFSKKSSKNHKLPPRKEKRDRTKTKEAKAKSKATRYSQTD